VPQSGGELKDIELKLRTVCRDETMDFYSIATAAPGSDCARQIEPELSKVSAAGQCFLELREMTTNGSFDFAS